MRSTSPDMRRSHWRALAPLALATMASQALLVVLSTTIVAISHDLGTSVATIGQARSITAAVSIAVSLALSARGDVLPVPRMLLLGSALAVAACGAVAAARSAVVFLAAHALIGLAVALLLSGGFAGVAAFAPERRAWATGYVAAASATAWIVVNPVAANLTEWLSWRAAQAAPAAIAVAALLAARYAEPVPGGGPVAGLWAPLTVPSARRWIGAEIAGYASWTALLTFSGGFFIERIGVRQSIVGWLLAGAAAAFFVASTQSGRLVRRVPRKRLVAVTALATAVLLPVMLTSSHAAAAVGVFCLMGLLAGCAPQRPPGSVSSNCPTMRPR